MAFEIQYLGHSTMLVTLESKKRIVIDPWLETNPSCPPECHSLSHIDLICLTHGHSDHAESALTLAKKTGAKVCATYELLVLLVKDGLPESQMVPMNKGGTVLVDDLKVTLTHAFHSNSYGAKDGVTHYAGEACGLVLRPSDGDSFYHAGDTALFSDMKLIGELYRPRVACLPIGDRFTMGPEEAAIAANWIKPKYVVPIHWGTFPLLSGTPDQLRNALASGEITVAELKPGETRKL